MPNINTGFFAGRLDKHLTINTDDLEPHKGKVVSIWSTKLLRDRKWYVIWDCNTNEIKTKLID